MWWGCDLRPWPGTSQRWEQQQQRQEGTGGKAQGETIGYDTNATGISKQGWWEGDARGDL